MFIAVNKVKLVENSKVKFAPRFQAANFEFSPE